jgi:hypothetical protein
MQPRGQHGGVGRECRPLRTRGWGKHGSARRA